MRRFAPRFLSMPTVVLVLTALIVAASLIPSVIAMASDEPDFTVELKDGDYEIRRYAPLLAAEVTVTGERSVAINQGFRVLADFIFGNNTARKKIDMTTPVTQQPSEKIAMTVPVTQQRRGRCLEGALHDAGRVYGGHSARSYDKRVTIIAEPQSVSQ